MAYDGSLKFDTKIDSKGFERDLNGLKSAGATAGKVIAAGIAAASAAIVGFGGYALKSSIEFESAFADVKKVLDGTPEQFAALEKGIRDMSKRLPQSAVEIAEVAAAAGQLGIKTEDVLDFTEVMVMLGDTTNLSSDVAATSLARLAAITGMSHNDFDRLGSTIVALGNNFATTEAEIVEMGLRLAGTGNQVGLSEEQILGLAAAMSSVGINAEAGGSSMSRVMQKINTEVLSGGANLEKFAQVAGMSAAEFSKTWKEEPEQAIVSFVEGLGRIQESGGDVTAALKEMGINSIQELDTLLRLSGASDKLSEALGISADAWEENTALLDEASQRYETTEAKIEILRNNITDLAIAVGDELKDSLLDTLDVAMEMVEGLSKAFEVGGFSGLVEELGSVIADVLVILAEAVPQMLESATAMVMSFIRGITDNLPQIIESGFAIVDSVIDTIVELLPALLDLGIKIIISLIEGIAEGLPNLISTGIELVITLADKVIENVPMLITAGLELLKSLVKGIMDSLPLLIQEAPRIINDFADAIYSMLPTILKAGIDILLEIIVGLLKTIPTLVANIPAIVQAIVNVITLYNWVNLGKSVITRLGQGIRSMVGNIGTIARNLASSVVQAIKNIFTQAPSVGSGFVSGIMSGIRSLLGSIVGLGGSMASSVMSAIRSAFSSASSIGANLVRGIWNGISSVTGWIIGKIRGFGSAVMNSIKGIFGIKSPSIVMRDEVGKNLVLGMEEGIQKEIPKLQRNLDKELSRLSARMKSTVDFETSNNAKVMTGSRGLSRGGTIITNNNDNGVEQHITIVSPQNTPSENARQMKKVGRELSLGY